MRVAGTLVLGAVGAILAAHVVALIIWAVTR